jgi:hypothetical protein
LAMAKNRRPLYGDHHRRIVAVYLAGMEELTAKL